MATPSPSPTTSGPIDRAPCPHCGQGNDLRDLADMIDTGAEIQCDHCKRVFEIVAIQPVTLVRMRPSNKTVRNVPTPQPAKTASPGIIRKLLGR